MKKHQPNTRTSRTAKPSSKERTGTDRLYKYTGARKVSFYYQYPNGASETLASAPKGDRQAINEAERKAKRKALDIQQGVVIAGSMAEVIERFQKEEDATHYRDQGKDGVAVRKGIYANLTKFFGAMNPKSVKMIHAYQYVDDRSKTAPAKAIKEIAYLSTICHYAVRKGIIESNPVVGMKFDHPEKQVRNTERSKVLQFYLWTQRQDKPQWKTLGCAALFCYLTGFRAAEVRPFHTSGLTKDGPMVIAAKRKKGEQEIRKLREWSPRLRMVVKRARQARGKDIGYLFANRHGGMYTKSGWGSVWADAMLEYIGGKPEDLTKHPDYFSMLDIRPVAISKKKERQDADVYDFAGNSRKETTDVHYDRRKIKRASATE
jgi:integrase